jgi:hypothetical protein
MSPWRKARPSMYANLRARKQNRRKSREKADEGMLPAPKAATPLWATQKTRTRRTRRRILCVVCIALAGPALRLGVWA